MKKNISVILLLLCGVMMVSLTACNDDDSSGGTPTITGVRTTDPEYADSLFTKAVPGSIIAIIGTNLSNALAVYVCDQEVFLNPTLNTNHSIIVTIPTEENGFVLPSTDSTLSQTIKVVTAGGMATYDFQVTAPSPTISRIDADYPRSEGTIVTVNGTNLVDIESAYITDIAYADLMEMTFTDVVPGNHTMIGELTTITSDHHLNSSNYYETTSVLSFAVPAGAPDTGTLVIECAAGNAYIGFSVLPGQPIVTYVSTDMPQIGEDLIITGNELLQAEISYGDVTLTTDEIYISETNDTIIVNFAKKPSVGSTPKLTITTPGGTVTIDRFYDHSTILTTFDNDDATDNGWGPNASYADSGTDDGIYAYIYEENAGQSWWGTMIYFRKDWNGNSFALSENIPGDAPATDIYFAYNIYDNNSAFNNGQFAGYLQYMIQPLSDAENYYDSGFYWSNYEDEEFAFDLYPLSDINGKNPKCQWYRACVSLNNFDCYAGKTYSEIVTTGLNQWRIMNYNQGWTYKGDIDIKIDNVRVIYIPSN